MTFPLSFENSMVLPSMVGSSNGGTSVPAPARLSFKREKSSTAVARSAAAQAQKIIIQMTTS
jgi:hypothetical protein